MFPKITLLLYFAISFSCIRLELQIENGLENIIIRNLGNKTEIIYGHSTEAPITSTDKSKVIKLRIIGKANKEDRCPKGLTYYRHFLGVPFCYQVTEPQVFPPKCPYSNYIEFDSITEIYKRHTNISLWVQAQRDFSDGFGDFQYIDKSSRYLNFIKKYENPGTDIVNKSCMIKLNHKYYPVLCTEKYPTLCVYSYSKSYMQNFCVISSSNFNQCISTGFDLNNDCYCVAQVEGFHIPRNEFCDKLAEPMTPFQNYLLFSLLNNKSPCWFGIEKTNESTFRWSHSNREITYFDWKNNTSLTKTYGALDYSAPSGWILEDDYALKCAICEHKMKHERVTISLKFLPKFNKIQVTITNMIHIQQHFPYGFVLSCFSDYKDDGFKFKVVSQITLIEGENFANDLKVITNHFAVKNYYPGYYWCETIQRPDFARVISNKILAYEDNGIHNHEYALVVTSLVQEGIDPVLDDHHVYLAKIINATLNVTDFINAVRPMKMIEFSETENFVKVLFRISTSKNDLTSLKEFVKMRNLLEKMQKRFSVNVTYLARSEVCLPSTTVSNNVTLNWPETPIGSPAIPEELCVNKDFVPVTRKCSGNFSDGGFWEDPEGDCYHHVEIPQTTLELYDLLNSDENSNVISEKLQEITKYNENFLVIDTHFVVKILEKLGVSPDLKVQEFLESFSNVMTFNSLVLTDAQKMLNSTDKALDALDKLLMSVNATPNLDYIKISSHKLMIQVSNMWTSNVIGIAIKNITNSTREEWIITKPLYLGVLVEEIIEEDVDLAIFLNVEALSEISNCYIGQNTTESMKLVLTFFYNDVLFNDVTSSERNKSTIISLLVPDFNCPVDDFVTVIFKPSQSENISCGFWNYGTNAKRESLSGHWDVESSPELITRENTYAACNFSHATHFALLMVSGIRGVHPTYEQETNIALIIITAVGCGFSLLGVSGIFVTALLFESWRTKTCNIIILNFSVSIAAQMIFLFLTDSAKWNTLLCYVTGVCLHYTLLSEFCWMLIIAILQYKKFVLVFDAPVRRLVLKCMIVGWGLPLIPIIILTVFFRKCYTQNVYGLCYPDGAYFYFGLLLPISLIILINFYVFIKILYSVCHKKVEAYGSNDNHVKLQVLLAILLFFLLGMSWIFGILTALAEWIVWSYLFCLTATFQGFVLFIFFIMMNENSRLLWRGLKKFCMCTKGQSLGF